MAKTEHKMELNPNNPAGLRAHLRDLSESKNADFGAKLTPTVNPDRFLGVRIPILRNIVAQVLQQPVLSAEFLTDVPHQYLEEDLLHIMLVNEIRDVDEFAHHLESFFPYIDNWMVTDTLGPKFKKDQRNQLESYLKRWIESPETYVARCAVVLLMQDFLDDAFEPEHLRWVASISSEDYYAHMVIGWYFATALAKQPGATLPVIEDSESAGVSLHPRARRMAIQKAIESRRIPEELKENLRALRASLKTKHRKRVE